MLGLAPECHALLKLELIPDFWPGAFLWPQQKPQAEPFRRKSSNLGADFPPPYRQKRSLCVSEIIRQGILSNDSQDSFFPLPRRFISSSLSDWVEGVEGADCPAVGGSAASVTCSVAVTAAAAVVVADEDEEEDEESASENSTPCVFVVTVAWASMTAGANLLFNASPPVASLSVARAADCVASPVLFVLAGFPLSRRLYVSEGTMGAGMARSYTRSQLTPSKKWAFMMSSGGLESAPRRRAGSRWSNPVSSVRVERLNLSAFNHVLRTRWKKC